MIVEKRADMMCQLNGRRLQLIATILLFFFLFSLGASALGQYRFRTVGMESGLSQNYVYCIEQDDMGFLWFGTQDGLNRYDGYQMKVFRHEAGDSRSIAHNHVNDLLADGEGGLWVATSRGLDRYHADTLAFAHVPLPGGGNTEFMGARVLYPEADKGIWIGTEGFGLFFLDLALGQFKTFKQGESETDLDSNQVTALTRDARGQFWVGTASGLHRFLGVADGFRRIPLGGHGRSAPIRVNTLLDSESSGLLVGTDSGLFRLSHSGEIVAHFQHDPHREDSLAVNQINVLFGDSQGTIWLGTEGAGLHVFRPQSGRFIRLPVSGADGAGLSDDRVTDIREDFSGVLWIGTRSGALNRLDLYQKQFQMVGKGIGAFGAEKNPQIWCLTNSGDGSVWVGSASGVSRYIPREKRMTDRLFTGTQEIKGLRVRALLESGKGDLWVGTENTGLLRLSAKNGRRSHFRREADNPRSLCDDRVRTLMQDKRGRIWIGTQAGISIWDEGRDNFVSLDSASRLPGNVKKGFITALLEDRDGRVWIGTLGGGLELFDPNGLGTKWLFHEDSDFGLLGDDRILSFLQSRLDRSGAVWVGTGGGLYRVHPEKGVIAHYTMKDGLANDVIYAIQEDDRQRLWLSSNRGLSCLEPFGGSVRNYEVKDGLQDFEFNVGASCRSLSGELFFGGMKGFNHFYPAEIKDNPIPPRLVLTDLKLFNESVSPSEDHGILRRTISRTDTIRLSYRDNVVSLEFAALHYQFPQGNRYAYMLEGLESQWNDSGSRRFVTYSRLPPGDYLFRLRAANSDGVWTASERQLKIVVVPPFWKTRWFLGLFILLAGAFVFFLHRLRIRSLKVKKKELEELVDMRTRELADSNSELQKLSIVARETDNAVFILDAAGGIKWVNEGFFRVYGEKPDSYLKKRGTTIFDVSSNPDIAKVVKRCRDSRRAVRYESSLQRADGQTLWTQTTLTPVLDENGEVVSFIAIDSDVTKIKQTEGELAKKALELEAANRTAEREKKAAENANRFKSEFLARMSHEIRTPMNGVLGFTEIVLDSNLSAEQRSQMEVIYRSGENLISLLNDILDFSKIEAGQMRFEQIDFDPEVTAFDVCELVMSRVNAEMVELLCVIEDRVPAYVRGDAGRFRQVLMNLMGNAVKFTEKGEITLRVSLDEENNRGQKLHVEVRDTGPGIEADKLESIFELFHQADGSTTRRYGGSGLGLTICRQIARLMGGDVWAVSSPGEGSTFHFTCWMDKSDKKPEGKMDHSKLAGRRILLVDDNRSNLAILQHTLDMAALRVVSCSDPFSVGELLEEALSQGDPFDLCILDIQMPGLSGLDLARTIRSMEAPIGRICLVAFSSSLHVRSSRYQEAGFNAYLPKPVRRKRLLSILGHLLDSSDCTSLFDEPSAIVTQHSVVEKLKHSVHILLVEDNVINQKLVEYMLIKAGYRVTIAADGEAAVRALTQEPEAFDLVLMDIQMPKMDGRAVSRKIRAMGFSDIPIVAMTAESMKGDREACLAAGMNDYIAKPIKREQVYEMVRKWIIAPRVG